ncbi:ABC transporter ATP-binding protein [Streptomyces sp. NPDC090088]|uniref:ABC transporter ATP-binding protein n=1 Tax=Streptomyces sp. NPDC090088 TaxID=3365944 RepID=UPI0038063CB7
MTSLLSLDALDVTFTRRGRSKMPVRAVDRVSFDVTEGETVGLIGESGSGKTTIGRAVLGLTPVTGGHITFRGEDITTLRAERRSRFAGSLQAVFQDPYGSLNPARAVGRSLLEPLEAHAGRRSADLSAEITRMLDEVSLPAEAADRYPHAFSGGQRQRLGIARAFAPTPQLVVCDEATSALDVVTQAQILGLLQRLGTETGVAMLFITHNLPLVAYLAQRVVVLYRGRVMERGPARDIHEHPLHPYTKALTLAVPSSNPAVQRARRAERAEAVSVNSANATAPPAQGCPFAPRCPKAADTCVTSRPADTPVGNRVIACHLFDSRSGHPQAPAAKGTT